MALLPNITLLNGSPVFVTEREDAERAYIRLYMDDEEKPSRSVTLLVYYFSTFSVINRCQFPPEIFFFFSLSACLLAFFME